MCDGARVEDYATVGSLCARSVDIGGDGVYGRLRIQDNEVVVCAPKGQSAPRH
jgi:hypothetical protein